MGLGYFVGPFLGALVILAVGTRGGFAVQSVGVVLAGYLMARMDDPPRPPDTEPGGVPLRQNLRRHRVLLATLGTGALLMGAARASCDAVLPPWADHLGLHAATASLVFGIGALADLLCSYPAGQVMDRYGRRLVAVPSLMVITVSFVVLPFTTTVVGMTAVAVLMGVGNGLGNGVIMTLGADVAPPATRAEFLAAWRLMHDSGMFLGPLAVGLVAAVAPLGCAAAALGAVSGLGAAVMHRFIPRYSPWPRGADAESDEHAAQKASERHFRQFRGGQVSGSSRTAGRRRGRSP
ncbi:MAG TPA: MFS transporter [Isoptericola sp.]|nr:MFS transporter [Isoptericola sp.]